MPTVRLQLLKKKRVKNQTNKCPVIKKKVLKKKQNEDMEQDFRQKQR